MSDDELNLNPQDVRGSAEQLAEVSTQIKNVMSVLQAKLGSYGPAPWGDDSIGHGFADGDKGYVAQASSVNQSVGALTDLLDNYAGQLRDAADSLEQQDQQQ
jgi:uncharacterized protein YukE